jgi:hypothetical protein
MSTALLGSPPPVGKHPAATGLTARHQLTPLAHCDLHRHFAASHGALESWPPNFPPTLPSPEPTSPRERDPRLHPS